MADRRDRFFRRFLPFLGIGLVGAILWSIDLGQLMRILARTDRALLGLGILLYLALLLIRTCRWRELLGSLGIQVPLPWLASWTILGSFLGALSPGRAGDLARMVALRRLGQPLAPSCASVVADRLIDVGFVPFVGAIVLLSPLLPLRDRILATAATGLVLALVVLLIGILLRGSLSTILRSSAGRWLPGLWAERMAEGIQGVGASLASYRPRTLLPAVSWTVLFWVVYVVCNVSLVRAVGIVIPTSYLILTLAAVAILAFLPISIGGLGTREGVLIVMLGRVGVSPEQAVAYSVLEIFLLYVVTGIAALPAWWYVTLWREERA